MKTVITLLVCAGACLLLLPNFVVAQSADELFQKAVQLETVKGELEQAISVYKNVVSKYPANQPLAAKSLLRMGRCYEKLGKDEAKKAYERIIKEYASQPDVVAEARARLAVLNGPVEKARGPVARRLLSQSDMDYNNFWTMVPSPDGRSVAYTQQASDGGLYLRDLASGKTHQLTSGHPLWTSSVVWSPNGKQLAFGETDMTTRLGAIKIIDVSSQKLIATFSIDVPWLKLVDWSPDGRYMLCNRPVPMSTGSMPQFGSLVLVTVGNGSMTTLVDSVPFQQKASFSADSRFVTYAAGKPGNEQVFIRPISGGMATQITSATGGNTNPIWSPDGYSIAYQRPEGIWVVLITNGNSNGTPRLAYASKAVFRWPAAWREPEGFYFAIATIRTIAYSISVDAATGEARGRDFQELTNYPEKVIKFVWSPNMQQIAFACLNQPQIGVYSAASKSLTSYDVGLGLSARLWWSRDGREIFFTSYPQARPGSTVMALNPVSGGVRELFPSIEAMGGMSLSADGRQMLFRRGEVGFGSGELVVAEAGSANGRVLAAKKASDGSSLSGSVGARFSPDSRLVLFARRSDKGTSLWVVPSDGDGTGARCLTMAKDIGNAVWDPSGRFIACTVQADSATTVLRIVQVMDGTERDIPVPNHRQFEITDWSPDGRLLGIIAADELVEYWVVQGLQEVGK